MPMRPSVFIIAVAALALPASGRSQSCSAGQTTSISGTVYAPNGTDPLPNVLVYIPSTTVGPLPPGISCPTPGQLPSGNPLAGAYTGTDSSFTLRNVPVGANIPLVILAGKWRRQTIIPGTAACQNTAVDPQTTRMPRNQSEGDIPKIAIATGSADQVECVLRKVGIDSSEFTNPSSSGRINFYQGSQSGSATGGAIIDSSTPDASTLMSNPNLLSSYDVLMLPCEAGQSNPVRPANQLANLIGYANGGGRVYASHFSYDWMYQNGDFKNVVNWDVNQTAPGSNGGTSGTATIDISFASGETLAEWLQQPTVSATTTQGQVGLQTLKHDLDGVIAPTQSWMTLNATGNPVMQFTFDTPVAPAGKVVNQCGRVLFDEYHVENGNSSNGKVFPAECSTGAMTPQEKLLEFTLFDLTGSGGAPTMTPVSTDFGSDPIHFTTAPKTFTWTNNSTFPVQMTSITASAGFNVTSNTCGSSVNSGATCAINVVFSPATLGATTGTLTVVSSLSTLTAALTGTGTADLTNTDYSALDFGNLDVGTTSPTQTIVWTNPTSGSVAVPPFSVTGDFAISGSTCGSMLGSSATCTISVIFKPTATGNRTGVFSTSSSDPAYSGLQTTLTGNGMDFIITIAPGSGSVIAGLSMNPTMTLTPVAGFNSNLTLKCPVTATASTCHMGPASVLLSSPVNTTVTISTTAAYTVVGYGGLGGGRFGLLCLVGMGSGLLLWRTRRSTKTLLRMGIFTLLIAAGGLSLSGCTGQLPTQNPAYTAPGTYAYTVTATDGIITHTATYSLTVTAR